MNVHCKIHLLFEKYENKDRCHLQVWYNRENNHDDFKFCFADMCCFIFFNIPCWNTVDYVTDLNRQSTKCSCYSLSSFCNKRLVIHGQLIQGDDPFGLFKHSTVENYFYLFVCLYINNESKLFTNITIKTASSSFRACTYPQIYVSSKNNWSVIVDGGHWQTKK